MGNYLDTVLASVCSTYDIRRSSRRATSLFKNGGKLDKSIFFTFLYLLFTATVNESTQLWSLSASKAGGPARVNVSKSIRK